MWQNKKFGKKPFKSSYEFKKDGQRVFNLSDGKRQVTFESWQMAKRLGWVKVRPLAH